MNWSVTNSKNKYGMFFSLKKYLAAIKNLNHYARVEQLIGADFYVFSKHDFSAEQIAFFVKWMEQPHNVLVKVLVLLINYSDYWFKLYYQHNVHFHRRIYGQKIMVKSFQMKVCFFDFQQIWHELLKMYRSNIKKLYKNTVINIKIQLYQVHTHCS